MRPVNACLVLAIATGLPSIALPQAANDPLLAEGRVIADEFAQTLQAALLAAMSAGGSAAAIDVCKTEAIEIASALSRRHGAKVGRTSLKTRNPLNLPEPWQAFMLSQFELEASAPDARAAPLEHFEHADGAPARYMRGIRTGGLCLACHGTAIPAEVVDVLERDYPFDRARGPEAGDLRGAFSVSWPLDEVVAPAPATPSHGASPPEQATARGASAP